MASPRRLIALSTIPSRARHLGLTVDSLLAQTTPADEILILRPTQIRKALTNGDDWSPRLRQLLEEKRISVASGPDLGPGTKLLGALTHLQGERALIITADDDIIYDPLLVETLLAAHQIYPGEALGFSGWSVGVRNGARGRGGNHVDVLEGFAGVFYDSQFFDAGIFQEADRCPECFWADDVWISGHLAERGVRRRVVPTAVDGLRRPIHSLNCFIDALKDDPAKHERNRQCARHFRFKDLAERAAVQRVLPRIRGRSSSWR